MILLLILLCFLFGGLHFSRCTHREPCLWVHLFMFVLLLFISNFNLRLQYNIQLIVVSVHYNPNERVIANLIQNRPSIEILQKRPRTARPTQIYRTQCVGTYVTRKITIFCDLGGIVLLGIMSIEEKNCRVMVRNCRCPPPVTRHFFNWRLKFFSWVFIYYMRLNLLKHCVQYI